MRSSSGNARLNAAVDRAARRVAESEAVLRAAVRTSALARQALERSQLLLAQLERSAGRGAPGADVRAEGAGCSGPPTVRGCQPPIAGTSAVTVSRSRRVRAMMTPPVSGVRREPRRGSVLRTHGWRPRARRPPRPPPPAQPTATARPEAKTDCTAGTPTATPTTENRQNATTADTTPTPGEHAPHYRTGRPPPDSLFHRGEGPAAQGPKPRRGASALAARPLREREGTPRQ